MTRTNNIKKRFTLALLCAIAFTLMLASAGVGDDRFALELSPLEAPCVGCHQDTTPGISVTWRLSAHGATNVRCTDCHGMDIKSAHNTKNKVEAKVCGLCHTGALFDQSHSAHARAHELPGVARGAGCADCHRVGKRCDTCHSHHSTEPDLATKVETCTVCHEADGPLAEILRSSAHGAVFSSRGEPTCQLCHMPGGSHNVSRALASGKPADRSTRERGHMVDICAQCHTHWLAANALQKADLLTSSARALLDEARSTLADLPDLADLADLDSDAYKNPSHAYTGSDNLSASFFEMDRAYRTVRMSAYHQNSASALKGMASLRHTLARLITSIETEKRIEALEQRLDNLAQESAPGQKELDSKAQRLRQQLRALKDSLLSGEISEEEFQLSKDKLLDEAGL